MDNLPQPYLRATIDPDAQHRLKDLLFVIEELFTDAGISVQFSRLNSNRGTGNHRVRVRSQALRTLASDTL